METRKVSYLTIDEARKLPNMLGVLASAALKAKGWYGYTDSHGEKIMLILKDQRPGTSVEWDERNAML